MEKEHEQAAVAVFSLILGCRGASAQTLSPAVQAFVKVNAPVVALTHVRVIDGTGAAAREDQTIILSKGKIESVGDASAANVPKDAQVLDLHGYSVIPGLVGMHDHMFYPMGNGIFGEMAIQFSAAVSGRRRDHDSHHRGARAVHRSRTQEINRRGSDSRAEDSRHWAVSGRRGIVGAADAPALRAGGCDEDGEFLARSGRRQFQGLHVHHAGGTGCSDSGGAQARARK